MVSTREENDEAYEVKRNLCQGQGVRTGDQRSEEDMALRKD